MNGTIRLGCHLCDRCDFDEIDELPLDWLNVICVQSLEDSYKEVEQADQSSNPFEWYTHLGTCPECQAEEQ